MLNTAEQDKKAQSALTSARNMKQTGTKTEFGQIVLVQ